MNPVKWLKESLADMLAKKLDDELMTNKPMTRDEARAYDPVFDLHCAIMDQIHAEEIARGYPYEPWSLLLQARYDEGLK